jgi:hypothetical protein
LLGRLPVPEKLLCSVLFSAKKLTLDVCILLCYGYKRWYTMPKLPRLNLSSRSEIQSKKKRKKGYGQFNSLDLDAWEFDASLVCEEDFIMAPLLIYDNLFSSHIWTRTGFWTEIRIQFTVSNAVTFTNFH